ncbi:MAG: carboxypeptidase-like regulatory domain-containing protein, partial [Acidobacteriaceae bacterium]
MIANSFYGIKLSRQRPRVQIGAWVICILLVTAGALQARGQAVYGSIYGTVADKSNAVIPNALITVTDVEKGTSTTTQTNESGEYRMQHLIPDTYRVKAEAKGFTSETVDNVVVFADTSPEVNLQLAVGTVSENVTVTGGAPLLQTDRADVSTILNERAVENLPNLNRNFTAFELLTPGTSYIGWGPGEGSGNP